MKNTFAFTADSLTVKGHTFPAEYIPGDGKITIFVTLDENDADKDAVIVVPADDPRYACIMAAINPNAAPAESLPETPAEEAELAQEEAPNNADAPEEQRPAASAEQGTGESVPRNPKEAHGPVPEKPFINTRIDGTGYSIFFNGEAKRTQIHFTSDANNRMIEAAVSAGFYYSPLTDTYNKKLTFKAYRAAVALAQSYNAA